MWGRSANLHLAQHYNALLSMMLSVYRTVLLSTTTRIAIHVQRIVKNKNSQDTSTIQTVLQSIVIGKESQKKTPFLLLDTFFENVAQIACREGGGINLGGLQSIAKYKV